MTKIKLAFVGAGYMTTEHMKAFSDIEDVVITGVCSKTRERAEKLAALYPGTIVCNTIDELYEKTKADIIIVLFGTDCSRIGFTMFSISMDLPI